jgi:hypothetical protein
MRYDTKVYFVSEKKAYDPDTGVWSDASNAKVLRRANVTDMGAQVQQAVFGDVKPTRKVVRLQHAHGDAYDYIQIGADRYYPDTEHYPSARQTLVVIRDG